MNAPYRLVRVREPPAVLNRRGERLSVSAAMTSSMFQLSVMGQSVTISGIIMGTDTASIDFDERWQPRASKPRQPR